VSNIQRELQAVLESIKGDDSMVNLKHGKNEGITVYVHKETIFKEMAAIIQ
jgi:hypothetical protein